MYDKDMLLQLYNELDCSCRDLLPLLSLLAFLYCPVQVTAETEVLRFNVTGPFPSHLVFMLLSRLSHYGC